MTIQEAIRSYKKFRRKNNGSYFEWLKAAPNNRGEFIKQYDSNLKGGVFFTYEDILADDWEIEEEKLYLTSRDIMDAYMRTIQRLSPTWIDSNNFEIQFLKELGFKP